MHISGPMQFKKPCFSRVNCSFLIDEELESLASLGEGMYFNRLLRMKSGEENGEFVFVTDTEFSYLQSIDVIGSLHTFNPIQKVRK